MSHKTVRTLAIAVLGLTLHVHPARAQQSTPPSTTPEEQLAELGEFLAEVDLNKAPACNPTRAVGGKLTPQQQAVCDRQNERIALWRERHAKLCKELKIQGGKYGCK